MRAIKYLPNYTVEDYQRWEGDWELIDGIPYAMSPSPVLKHQILGTALLVEIQTTLKKDRTTCNKCLVVYEMDWIANANTVLRPDIAIICDETSDYITKPPALIIEILSPSTAINDQQIKFAIYQEYGVMHYVIVDPNTKLVNIFSLEEGIYTEQNDRTSFTIHSNCSINLDLKAVLAELV